MTLTKWLNCFVIIALGALLASCYPGYKETVADIKHTQDSLHQKEQTYNPPPPPVMEKTGAYVNTQPISLDRPPRWLRRQVTVHGANLPVTFYIDQVLANTGATLHFDNDVQRSRLISMDFRGTVQGALDEIASKSDYAYHINNKRNTITWSAFETKTFDVSFLPGNAKYEVGGSQGGSGGSSDSVAQGGVGGGDSGGGSGGVTINYTGTDLSKTSQYSNLTGTISVWKDLETSVKNLMSKEGKVTVSQATTTITVRDHPENVASIAEFIKKMNKELSKQVRIQVQVLTVQLTHDFEYGINWDIVRKFGSVNQASLTGPLVSNASTGSAFSPLALEFRGNSGAWEGTQMVIQALSRQGKVSVVTQPTVTTLNNQVAEITIQQQESYIQSISNSVTQTNSTSGVNPGVITTGFNLFLLPKIQGKKVFLQLSTTISDLESIKEINANTGNVTSNSENQDQAESTTTSDNADDSTSGESSDTDGQDDTNQDNGSPSVIQVPTIDERKFNQRSVVASGTTLILAGFKERRNSANKSSFLYSETLGGKGGANETTELVLLITPVIINSGDTF